MVFLGQKKYLTVPLLHIWLPELNNNSMFGTWQMPLCFSQIVKDLVTLLGVYCIPRSLGTKFGKYRFTCLTTTHAAYTLKQYLIFVQILTKRKPETLYQFKNYFKKSRQETKLQLKIKTKFQWVMHILKTT